MVEEIWYFHSEQRQEFVHKVERTAGIHAHIQGLAEAFRCYACVNIMSGFPCSTVHHDQVDDRLILR